MSIEINISKLAYGGDGVATLASGKTVFVSGALPGDTVRATVVEEHAKFDKAVCDEVLEASPQRIAAPCPYAGVCGGCPWQTLAYEAQLQWKRAFVVDALSHIGKIQDAAAMVGKCVASKKEWGYRNKIELVPTMDGRKLKLGYHTAGSDQVVSIDSCLLLPKAHVGDPKALAGSLRFLKADEYGLVRAGIRTSARTGSSQVAIWTQPGYFPRGAASNVMRGAFKTTSLVRVMTKDVIEARKPSKVEVLDGVETWRERVGDFEMSISAPSFFQVNTAGAESLVAIAMTGLQVTDSDVCCDLYCGAGTFTLPLAANADLVFAVESASSSVQDLRRNLDYNGLDAEVLGGDAVRESQDIGKVDKLVLDPPYSGMSPDIFDRIAQLSPQRIAMVSCNPTTLARDLSGIIDKGYVVEQVTPVDMFPQTFHVETVTILRKDGTKARPVAKPGQGKQHSDGKRDGHGRAGGDKRPDNRGGSDGQRSHAYGHGSGRAGGHTPGSRGSYKQGSRPGGSDSSRQQGRGGSGHGRQGADGRRTSGGRGGSGKPGGAHGSGAGKNGGPRSSGPGKFNSNGRGGGKGSRGAGNKGSRGNPGRH